MKMRKVGLRKKGKRPAGGGEEGSVEGDEAVVEAVVRHRGEEDEDEEEEGLAPHNKKGSEGCGQGRADERIRPFPPSPTRLQTLLLRQDSML